MNETDSNDEWRWGNLVVECLEEFKAQQELPVRFVDVEVMPRFDGGPDGMVVWFICAKSSETSSFSEQCLSGATDDLRRRMLERGYPKLSAATLRTSVTSLQEIEEGGGRFYYFR